jgi:hypothetical protein
LALYLLVVVKIAMLYCFLIGVCHYWPVPVN